MSVVLAYWSVVLIWSTTPLGVAASNDSLTFWSAAGLRMLIALSILLVIIFIRRKPLFVNHRVVLSYAVAAVCFGPQMSLVYWAAQYVPTGVVSIVFSLSPCLTYLVSLVLMKDVRITLVQVFALLIALLGMTVIYLDKISFTNEAGWGMAALLVSVLIFAVCSVLLKKLTTDAVIDPFCQAAGTLLFSFPLFGVMWLCFDGILPRSISLVSLAGVSYLAVFGSVMGSSLYFYIVSRMDIVKVSLITMITPIISISVGAIFWQEALTVMMLVGSGTVLLSLLLFEGVVPRKIKPWVAQGWRGITKARLNPAA